MRWKVEGAESVTGRDRLVEVDALTRQGAEEAAFELGVLASRVSEMPPPPSPAYPEATRERPDAPSAPSAAPAYGDIVAGHKWLATLAAISSALGVVSLVVAAVYAFGFVAKGLRDGYDADAAGLLGTMVGSAVAGFGFLLNAALLRFVGAVGLAMRDTARNSFR